MAHAMTLTLLLAVLACSSTLFPHVRGHGHGHLRMPADLDEARSVRSDHGPHCATLDLDAEAQSVRSEDDFLQLFFKWMVEYARIYPSFLEQQHRFNIFRDNLLYILGFNQQPQLPSYLLGLSNFTDVTQDEFQEHYLGLNDVEELASTRRGDSGAERFVYENVDAPDKVDWREKGAVTEVKNQGRCGSCWSFSATGAVEGAHKIKRGELLSLSEQQLLDCCTNGQPCDNCFGCRGGIMPDAFAYIKANGIRTEGNYSYEEDTKFHCRRPPSTLVQISGMGIIPNNRKAGENLLKAVAMQPVSVGIDALNRNLQHYKGGIFNGACDQRPNHAVLVVGYGTSEDGKDYWIIKNSWGSKWGEKGYFRLSQSDNICGINTIACFPII